MSKTGKNYSTRLDRPATYPQRDWAIAVTIAIATLLIYSRAVANDFVNFDDQIYVTVNRHVQNGLTLEGVAWALSAIDHANWHPLTWLSLQLDHALFGLSPVGYHLTSVLLHVANSALLFWVLRSATGNVTASAAVAGLFALHPLRVESVAWVAERKDVLSGLFWLLTLLAYDRYARRPSVGWYATTIAMFVFGLASKAMVVTLPCVLLLWDYWPLYRCCAEGLTAAADSHPRSRPRFSASSWQWLLIEKAPLLVLSAAGGVLAILAQHAAGAVQSKSLTVANRLAHVPIAYIEYLAKTIWPRHLAVYYPYPSSPHSLPAVIAATLTLGGITLWALRRRRQRYLAVGWLWFLGTLLPVIGLIQVGGQSIADRYTYLPSIGPLIAVVWGADELARRNPFWRRVVVGGVVVLVLASAAATWVQIGYWRDGISLWRHALEVVGEDRQIHERLGGALVGGGRDAEAIPYLMAAVRAGCNNSSLHTNLGVALFRLGRYPESEQEFAAALAMDESGAETAYNLGCARLKLGETAGAIAAFEKTVSSDPQHWQAYLALAEVWAIVGDKQKAQQNFSRAVYLSSEQAQKRWSDSHPHDIDAAALAERLAHAQNRRQEP